MASNVKLSLCLAIVFCIGCSLPENIQIGEAAAEMESLLDSVQIPVDLSPQQTPSRKLTEKEFIAFFPERLHGLPAERFRDYWGEPFYVEVRMDDDLGNVLRVTSGGPDKTVGTLDDLTFEKTTTHRIMRIRDGRPTGHLPGSGQ